MKCSESRSKEINKITMNSIHNGALGGLRHRTVNLSSCNLRSSVQWGSLSEARWDSPIELLPKANKPNIMRLKQCFNQFIQYRGTRAECDKRRVWLQGSANNCQPSQFRCTKIRRVWQSSAEIHRVPRIRTGSGEKATRLRIKVEELKIEQ